MLKNQLKDPSLLVDRAYVDGQWISADDGATLTINNPATGEALAQVPALQASKPCVPSKRLIASGLPGAHVPQPNARRCWSAGIRRCSTTSKTWR